ncbi:solute carrier family 23 member 3 isoform X2 [Stegostoma tigrinum]|uniref:solute carrier family 23 member 3 isoform X2 n=1 Tax=Stegostoma tigrinum TaxID=3053191 RepID=UPI0028702BD5|nr:solute carrier family 23 member 3 isoform X2 [Stegostoma tigrinum]
MEDCRSPEQGPKREAEIARYPFHRRPPWILSILFAVQHVLVQTALLQTVHCLLIDALPSNQIARQHGYQFMATSLFASGISTLLQTTLGSRLPLVQASSFEYLIPALTLVTSPTETNSTLHNGTDAALLCEGAQCPETDLTLQMWKSTLCEVRGAVIVSGILHMSLGFSGLQGLVSRHCGPMVLAPMLSIIGLSCYKEVANFSSSHWGITALLVLLVVLLSQYLRSCYVPVFSWKRSKGFVVETYFPLFRIFSEGNILNPYHPGAPRGILRSNGTALVLWFNMPIPGEWGAPTINVRSMYIGVVMALGTSIGSLGSYMMCAKVIGCQHPPSDAANRGIFLEGVGSCIGALLGGITTTSSSVPSVGALALTQMLPDLLSFSRDFCFCALTPLSQRQGCPEPGSHRLRVWGKQVRIQAESRHSIQIAAVLCILLGMSTKLMYLLATIPAAVHGGVLSVTYTMAVSVGVSYFQYTNIDSGRNIFIIGFTMFMALLTPHWFIRNPDYTVTGIKSVDTFLLALFMMPIIQGGILAFLLDNTVTGTLEERGFVAHFPSFKSEPKDLNKVYQFPSALQRYLWVKPFPLCNLCPSSELTEEHVAEGQETKSLLPTREALASGGESGGVICSRFTMDPSGTEV